jgi:hypothetical protein
VAVNDTNKHASIVEGLARVAELICRFAITEDLYLHGTSNAVEELERAMVNLYASVLVYLSRGKQYLEQGAVSTYLFGLAFVHCR